MPPNPHAGALGARYHHGRVPPGPAAELMFEFLFFRGARVGRFFFSRNRIDIGRDEIRGDRNSLGARVFVHAGEDKPRPIRTICFNQIIHGR